MIEVLNEKTRDEVRKAVLGAIEKTIPEEIRKDIEEMSARQAMIDVFIHHNIAIPFDVVEEYNEFCYKLFPERQTDDVEAKEDQKPEEDKVPTPRRFGFDEAIRLLKEGEKLSRDGWNGKRQFIQLAVTVRFDTFVSGNIQAHHKAIVFNGTSGIQVGWLASQADMLAEDWHIYGQ